MSGGKQTSTTTQTQTMPRNQQRAVDLMLQGATQNYMGGGRTFFPGDIIADFDPLQTAGQNQIVNFAGGVGTDLINQAIDANSIFLDPSNLFNPGQIPGFQGVSDAITRQMTQNLTENILPSIRQGAIGSGQFGGSAQGIGEGLAVGRTNDSLGDALSQLNLGAYQMGLNAMQNAIGRAPALMAAGALPGQMIADVGATRQNQAQREIGGQMARHEFEQNEPIFQLQLLRDLAGSFGQYGGTTTSRSEQEVEQSVLNKALGAALLATTMFNPALFGAPAAAATGSSGLMSGIGAMLMPGMASTFNQMLGPMQPTSFIPPGAYPGG